MKKINWQILLGLFLVSLSAVLYGIHYLIFRDAHHISTYFITDLAFLPIDVLLVTLIIHQILSRHEKRAMLKKMNMVIGAFFTEVGTDLLRNLAGFDVQFHEVQESCIIRTDWTPKIFTRVSRGLKKYNYTINSTKGDLNELRTFLISKRDFLVSLLGNANLLEHKSFTDLLWAVCHLTEELVHRNTFSLLPDADYEHLSGDIKRAYGLLITEWLAYMKHLKGEYPYLFSLAVRTNPFDEHASVVLT